MFAALALLDTAQTADQLRLAQAVLLPLTLGMSLAQTAQAIGRSVSATCAMRTRFARVASGSEAPPRAKTALRNRAFAELDAEARLLERVCGRSGEAGVDLVLRLQREMQAVYGAPVALSSAYRLLHRHGWRRISVPVEMQAPLPPGGEERRARLLPRWMKG